MGLSFAGMIVWAAVVLVPAALVLVVVGWRGRRVGDHPHCRRCEFDLFGLREDAAACPECGADTRSAGTVRIGVRERRRGMVLTGAALLLLSGGWLGLVAWGAASNVNWQPYKPVWWLRIELSSGNRATADAALKTLKRRIEFNALSQRQIDGLIDEALSRQADLNRPWNPRWGDLVEKVQAEGKLDAARAERYAEQAVDGAMTFKVRPRVTRGAPISYRIVHGTARVGDDYEDRFYLRMKGRTLTLGGVREVNGGGSGHGLSATGGGWSGRTFQLSTEQWAMIPDGNHTLTCETQGTVRTSSKGSAPVIWSSPMTFSAEVEIVPADRPTATPMVDASQRAAVEAALSPGRLELRNQYGTGAGVRLAGRVNIRRPPIGVAFEVFVRTPDGREWRIGQISKPAGGQTSYHIGRNVPGFPVDQKTVDLILRPSREVAAGTVDVFEYWGDEVVLKGVSVEDKRNPRTSGSGTPTQAGP